MGEDQIVTGSMRGERARRYAGDSHSWGRAPLFAREEVPGLGGTPRFCHREWKKRQHPWDTHYQVSIKTLLSMRACDP